MVESNPFRVEKDGAVAWLTFDRPEKRNSMDMGFFDGLTELFPGFDEDPDVRVIVIKAEGRTFNAGIDLQALEFLLKEQGADVRERLRKVILRLQKAVNVMEGCRKPIIAAVHGYCIGGGVDLLCACDIRMAAREALFSIREVRMALVADLGTLQRLPHIIGDGWFRELALTGRNFSAEEALGMGFITHLCENREALYEEAGKLAEEIASLSPLAVQGAKDVILYSRDRGVYPGLEYVAQKNAALLHSEDVLEAFRAFVEKRPPEFKGK
jgi:enoyl-CoA hydratase/carnithine racemase